MKIIDADMLINKINRVLPDWSEEKEIILDTITNMPSIEDQGMVMLRYDRVEKRIIIEAPEKIRKQVTSVYVGNYFGGKTKTVMVGRMFCLPEEDRAADPRIKRTYFLADGCLWVAAKSEKLPDRIFFDNGGTPVAYERRML